MLEEGAFSAEAPQEGGGGVGLLGAALKPRARPRGMNFGGGIALAASASDSSTDRDMTVFMKKSYNPVNLGGKTREEGKRKKLTSLFLLTHSKRSGYV